MIIDALKRLMDSTDGNRSAQNPTEEDMRIAAAALLVHAAGIDGRTEETERRTLASLLARRFRLDEAETAELIALGTDRERQAVDLYGFTKTLAPQLDQDGRKQIVEMLWEVVVSDERVDEYESNLVWRVAELLGVSTRDRVTLKQKVLTTRERREND